MNKIVDLVRARLDFWGTRLNILAALLVAYMASNGAVIEKAVNSVVPAQYRPIASVVIGILCYLIVNGAPSPTRRRSAMANDLRKGAGKRIAGVNTRRGGFVPAPKTADVAAAALEVDQGPRDRQFGKGHLVALLGAGCCAVLVPAVRSFEGRELVPYRDIVKVWTVCDGDTKDVVPGQAQTDAQCDERLERQLVAHAKPVLECVPQLKGKPNALAAGISLAYNIGPARFCHSTAAARFRAGNIKGGCDALLMFDRAGGRVVAGLARRRSAERAICMRDAA
jgi:lysozyme